MLRIGPKVTLDYRTIELRSSFNRLQSSIKLILLKCFRSLVNNRNLLPISRYIFNAVYKQRENNGRERLGSWALQKGYQ